MSYVGATRFGSMRVSSGIDHALPCALFSLVTVSLPLACGPLNVSEAPMATVQLTKTRESVAEGRVLSSIPGIDCGPQCDGAFPVGALLVLTATNTADSIFSGWSGDCERFQQASECVLRLDGDRNVGAHFEVNWQDLELSVLGLGAVELTSSEQSTCADDCRKRFPKGAPLLLRAIPQQGFSFVRWLGACRDQNPDHSCRLDLGKAQFVEAIFEGDRQAPSVLYMTPNSGGRSEGLTLDELGTVYTTGWFDAPLDLGQGLVEPIVTQGSNNVYITRLATNGRTPWTLSFDNKNDRFSNLAVDNHLVYVTGWFESADFGSGVPEEANERGALVAAYDREDGAYRWHKSASGPGRDQALSIAASHSGNIYVAGWFSDAADFGSGSISSRGGQDAFVISYDSDGEFRWSRTFGGTGEDDRVHGVFVGPDGTVFLVGAFEGTIDFGGGPRTSAGLHDAFVVALDEQGRFLWDRVLGGSGEDQALAGASPRTESIYIAGFFEESVFFSNQLKQSRGAEDGFVARLDNQGAVAWGYTFGGPDKDTANAIAIDPSENSYVVGTVGSLLPTTDKVASGFAEDDVFVLSLNHEGHTRFTKVMGGPGRNRGTDIGVSQTGQVYVTGSFSQEVHLGNYSIDGQGGSGFLVQFTP